MRIRILLLLINLAVFTSLYSQSSAEDILKEAKKIAAKEKKNIFILFHASWCGWCHRMDSAMNDPEIRQFFTDNYVIRHLVILESPGKRHLENHGAMALLHKYKGNDQGIPYWLIFDKKGNLLADSKIRPEGATLEAGYNSGYPAHEKEAFHFINTIRQTSSLQQEQLLLIEKRFRIVN